MGWNIGDLMDVLKLRNQSIMYFQQVAYSGSEMHLIPDAELAALYQISDAFVLISGEGFGLPTFEAMATKLPCILLDYAASSELGAEGRAELVPSAGSLTWTGSHLTQRPLPEPKDIVQSLLRIFRDRERRNNIAKAGYDFATKYTWDRVANDWDAMFRRHEYPFIGEMKMEVIA